MGLAVAVCGWGGLLADDDLGAGALDADLLLWAGDFGDFVGGFAGVFGVVAGFIFAEGFDLDGAFYDGVLADGIEGDEAAIDGAGEFDEDWFGCGGVGDASPAAFFGANFGDFAVDEDGLGGVGFGVGDDGGDGDGLGGVEGGHGLAVAEDGGLLGAAGEKWGGEEWCGEERGEERGAGEVEIRGD